MSEWERVCQSGAIDKMRQFLQSFPSSRVAEGLRRSYPLHTKRWHFEDADVDGMTQEALDWYAERKVWMDSQISGMADCIGNPSAEDRQTCNRKIIRDGHLYIIKDGKTYNPDGKRVK